MSAQGDRVRRRRAESANNGAGPTVGLSVGDHDVTFTAGGVKVSTRLLDGSYPDYRQLIPAEYPNRLHVGKDSLLDASGGCGCWCGTTRRRCGCPCGAAGWTSPWSPRRSGDASETVDADFDGSDLTIAFNPTYLIDGVEAVSGDEVVLETVDATKPATVRAAEETNFRYLLMPVRVS
jgi:DNA polymerase-3 subunit beta